MLRVLVLATLFVSLPRADSAQTLSVLHIKVAVVDANGTVTPVPRHALLISDNPATAAPRLIVTTLNGTVDVKLRPGNYTVESDRPVVFDGKAYQWTQTVDIVAGREAVLELTVGNAEVVPAASATTASGRPLEADPSFIVPQWQNSVVALWTPYTHASGFVTDARGLVATNQRVIGTEPSVEVQLSPAIKVEARVLASDSVRDVAVLWVNPKAIAAIRPLPLACQQTVRPPVVPGQEIFTIAVPLRQQKDITSGKVSRVEWGAVFTDITLESDGTGGPAFTANGDLVGITSLVEDDENARADVRIVPTDNACAVLAAAEKKMEGAAPPGGTPLPVEPVGAFPVDSLKEVVERRAGSLNPYKISSSDFDVAFITPVLTYGAQYKAEQARERERGKGARTPDAGQGLPALMDFGNWSNYVEDLPPVLLVRVTPKMVEGFWTTVARGAARTQGVAIPPLKRFKYGFSRLRAFCGNTEVTPIHPFKLEHRVSETSTMYEGLYVFDPDAFGPECGAVTLVLYSDKEAQKGDTRAVDPAVIQQIWQDFAPYRALNPRR